MARDSGTPRVGHEAKAVLPAPAPVRYRRSMDHDDAPRPIPAGWQESLDRSDADLAAGRTVPGEAVMERLRQTLAEMEADTAATAPAGGTTLHR